MICFFWGYCLGIYFQNIGMKSAETSLIDPYTKSDGCSSFPKSRFYLAPKFTSPNRKFFLSKTQTKLSSLVTFIIEIELSFSNQQIIDHHFSSYEFNVSPIIKLYMDRKLTVPFNTVHTKTYFRVNLPMNPKTPSNKQICTDWWISCNLLNINRASSNPKLGSFPQKCKERFV